MRFFYARRIDERVETAAPAYKSRGERLLADMLERHDIPFIYERPTLVHLSGTYRTWYPDFTLPLKGDLIVEYAGMLDDPTYATGIRRKLQTYQANGLPAMFVCPQDLRGAGWEHRMIDRIEQTIWRY